MISFITWIAETSFRRLNGRIKVQNIKEYVKQFGLKYDEKFRKKLAQKGDSYLRTHGKSIQTEYDNLVLWRHQFAHAGIAPPVTYKEVTGAYERGKEVIVCLAETMKR